MWESFTASPAETLGYYAALRSAFERQAMLVIDSGIDPGLAKAAMTEFSEPVEQLAEDVGVSAEQAERDLLDTSRDPLMLRREDGQALPLLPRDELRAALTAVMEADDNSSAAAPSRRSAAWTAWSMRPSLLR